MEQGNFTIGRVPYKLFRIWCLVLKILGLLLHHFGLINGILLYLLMLLVFTIGLSLDILGLLFNLFGDHQDLISLFLHILGYHSTIVCNNLDNDCLLLNVVCYISHVNGLDFMRLGHHLYNCRVVTLLRVLVEKRKTLTIVGLLLRSLGLHHKVQSLQFGLLVLFFHVSGQNLYTICLTLACGRDVYI